jgi:DNA-binding NarL/FixJ family response regulator
MTITVVIADDDPLVRAAVAMLLQAQVDVDVVGLANDGAEAVDRARTQQPDIVVMDLQMPGLDGVSATRLIAEMNARSNRLTKVLVLTTFNDDELVCGALGAGASGFLLKESAVSDLPGAIRRVAGGDSWIDPAIGAKVIRAMGRNRQGTSRSELINQLTIRERQLLTLMAEGLSNDEIAQQLVLSVATVKTHVGRILMKTGSHDRTRAVVLAYQSGLVIPPSRTSEGGLP